MANAEHLEILRQGVEQWNKWRQEHRQVEPDFLRANLSGANLSGANLNGGNLSRANLSGANLNGADLNSADLSRANLYMAHLHAAGLTNADLNGADISEARLNGAYLGGANLQEATLRGADLHEADLNSANLTIANLSGADFTKARTWGTLFADVDLSAAKGLELVNHQGPSTIGIDTIYKSRGKIPEVFLRGCGVPDEFIAYVGSMLKRPIEFYSCFISYSTKDQEFAERLHADLQAKGVRCWFAPHDIKGGRKVHEQIDEAIRLHDRLLLILSKDSMSSEWVKTEIAKARKREVKEGKRVLFPVRLVGFEALRDWECLDADTGKDSAREIREYFIPDFSNWKDHDSYQEAFQRLVKDLKAGDRG